MESGVVGGELKWNVGNFQLPKDIHDESVAVRLQNAVRMIGYERDIQGICSGNLNGERGAVERI